MNKFAIFGVFLSLALLPSITLAHETVVYEINGVEYEFVIGSLGEPVLVDDKTGVDLELVRAGAPLVGAQESLQVELIAGDAKKTVNLSPVYGSDGRYKSNFIATVPTTLSYRFFGTLENTPVDLTFTCNPAGHPAGEEDTVRKEISENVVQTLHRGAFGCPQDKEQFGFPEAVSDDFTLQQQVMEAPQQEESSKESPLPMIALIIAVLAGAVATAAYIRK